MALRDIVKQHLTQEQMAQLQVPALSPNTNFLTVGEMIGIKAFVFNRSIADNVEYMELCYMVCVEQN